MIELCPCIECMFEDIPFLERIDRVAAAGLRAFEFWSWAGKDIEAIGRRARARGLQVGAFSCGTAQTTEMQDWDLGELTNPAYRPAYLEGVRQSLQVASALGCRRLVVHAGNTQAGLSREDQCASIVAGLRAAAPLAEQAGVTLVLEPLNTLVDHPGHFLERSSDAVRIVQQVNSPHVRILFDIYHQQVSEGNVTANLTGNMEWIGHIHAADVPGRHQPGTGELSYPHIFHAIERVAYRGLVGLEYWPLGDSAAGLAQVQAQQAGRSGRTG